MSTLRAVRAAQGLSIALMVVALAGCEIPATQKDQSGYRGTGLVNVQNPRIVAEQRAAIKIPAALPRVPSVGPPASAVYQNVQVLGDLSVGEFARLMVSITAWVSPEQGCNYCHISDNLASDAVYTKVVARRMLQMTQQINSEWNVHVAATGVNCYTCHRGQPVPGQVWFKEVDNVRSSFAGNRAGQNMVGTAVGTASLPSDPFSAFLEGSTEIRGMSTTALPTGNRASIKQAEWTFGLMMHMSTSLGVNCTYCHNSRSFNEWDESRAQRTPAWHAIRMVREINNDYLNPLVGVFPTNRLGPSGDVAKVNCGTCHQGVYKPLFGTPMLVDHPELAGPGATSSAAINTPSPVPAQSVDPAAEPAADPAAIPAVEPIPQPVVEPPVS